MKKKDVEKYGFVINSEVVSGGEVSGEHNKILKVLISPEVRNYKKDIILISDIPPGKSTGMHTHDADGIIYVASSTGYNECCGKK